MFHVFLFISRMRGGWSIDATRVEMETNLRLSQISVVSGRCTIFGCDLVVIACGNRTFSINTKKKVKFKREVFMTAINFVDSQRLYTLEFHLILSYDSGVT